MHYGLAVEFEVGLESGGLESGGLGAGDPAFRCGLPFRGDGRFTRDAGTAAGFPAKMVGGARIELLDSGASPVTASSDQAGNFNLTLPRPGEYAIRAGRLGFFVYQGGAERFTAGPCKCRL